MFSHIQSKIDHTCLNPAATPEDICKLIDDAARMGAYSVCVAPYYVPYARYVMHTQHPDTELKLCAVVGFPHGNTMPQVKIFEAEEVLRHGANEVDMVLNRSGIATRNDDLLMLEINGLADVCKKYHATLKVIVETSDLTEDEKVYAAQIVRASKADFIKTSTGFGKGGATVEDVALLKANVGDKLVKASGGIRTAQEAQAMIDAGADRIGASKVLADIERIQGEQER